MSVFAIQVIASPGDNPPDRDLHAVLRRLGIEFGPGCGMPISKEVRRGGRFTTILAGGEGTNRARIEITGDCSGESARKNISDQIKMIEGMHGAFRTGYPGMITKQVDPPGELKPVRIVPIGSGGPLEVMLLRASERLTYGLGDPSQVVYVAAMAFFHSEELRMLVRVELFYPVDGFDRDEAVEEIASLRFISSVETGEPGRREETGPGGSPR